MKDSCPNQRMLNPKVIEVLIFEIKVEVSRTYHFNQAHMPNFGCIRPSEIQTIKGVTN